MAPVPDPIYHVTPNGTLHDHDTCLPYADPSDRRTERELRRAAGPPLPTFAGCGKDRGD